MDKDSGNGWELRLGLIHVVAVVAVTLGCVFGAYYLGFFAGRVVGFDSARMAGVAEVAKLPINDKSEDAQIENTEESSEIYEKLGEADEPQEPEHTDKHAHEKEDKSDQSKVKVAKATRQDDGAEDLPSAAEINNAVDAGTKDIKDQHEKIAEDTTEDHETNVRVLGGGDKSNKNSSKTLGMLLDERVEKLKSATPSSKPDQHKELPVEEKIVEPTPTPMSKKEPTPAPTKVATPTRSPTKTPAKLEKTEKEDKEHAAVVKNNIPSGWFAQVAAPKKLSEAEALVKKLKKAGFAVMIENANVRGESYYRVVVGPESNKGQAELLVDQIKREGVVKGDPFLRRVK